MKKNKEWLKEEIKKASNNYPTYHDERDDLIKKMVNMHEILELIDQLDEPELPVIPQFVADWIKECKTRKHNLFGVYQFSPEVVSVWIFENESKKERVDLIARAWLDGYTVEKEPEWTVKLDNGRYVDNFIESITGVEIDLSHRLGCTAPIIFKDKSKAESVALLVGGEVVEVMDNV